MIYMADFSLPTEEFLAQHEKIVDEELLAILRGESVPLGVDNYGRKISRYDDLWEEMRLNTPMPFEPRRSTFWDQPLASQRPSPTWSHSPSLPAQRSEIDRMTPVQSPVGAERSSSNPSQLEPWLAEISTANISTANISTANISTANISTANISTENISTATPTSTQRWAGWNPKAKEYYPSSSLYAPSLGVSPAETLTTNNTPSSSPEPQQGTDAPHPGPTNTRHDMKPAAVPTAIISRASYPLQAPSFRSVHPILPQHAAASGVRGMEIAASALFKWVEKHPNAGPVREVLSQSIYGKQDQTRHQEELELRKRVDKEEAAMRARRVRPLF